MVRSDEELITAVAAGDRGAFRELVARHRGPLHRYLLGRAPTAQAAEDALQETFLTAWRGAASYRSDGSPRSWLFGLARHHAARTWRLRAGEPRDPEPLDAVGAGWGSDPETLAAAVEDRDRVVRALAALDPADREILELRDLEQLSGPETADALGIGLAAMKSRLHRARLRLMTVLREEVVDA